MLYFYRFLNSGFSLVHCRLLPNFLRKSTATVCLISGLLEETNTSHNAGIASGVLKAFFNSFVPCKTL